VRLDVMQRTKQAVAARIRRVSAHLPLSEFEALVSRIAQLEIKYALRRRENFFDSEQALMEEKPQS
jgi:hypothetical protein